MCIEQQQQIVVAVYPIGLMSRSQGFLIRFISCEAGLKSIQKLIGYHHNLHITIAQWAHLAWEVSIRAFRVHSSTS